MGRCVYPGTCIFRHRCTTCLQAACMLHFKDYDSNTDEMTNNNQSLLSIVASSLVAKDMHAVQERINVKVLHFLYSVVNRISEIQAWITTNIAWQGTVQTLWILAITSTQRGSSRDTSQTQHQPGGGGRCWRKLDIATHLLIWCCIISYSHIIILSACPYLVLLMLYSHIVNYVLGYAIYILPVY